MRSTPKRHSQLAELSKNAAEAVPLIQTYGDDMKARALQAAMALQQAGPGMADQAKPVADTGDARASRSRCAGMSITCWAS